MSVRAKFYVSEVTKSYYPNTTDRANVKLNAVMDADNKTWAKYTPSGSITLSIDNPAAVEQFKPGEYYFVDFSPAPQKEAEEVNTGAAVSA
jgi:hypothetical protein